MLAGKVHHLRDFGLGDFVGINAADAHAAAVVRAQGYVELGIGQARRGWLTKDDLLNTQPWGRFQKLRRKRP